MDIDKVEEQAKRHIETIKRSTEELNQQYKQLVAVKKMIGRLTPVGKKIPRRLSRHLTGEPLSKQRERLRDFDTKFIRGRETPSHLDLVNLHCLAITLMSDASRWRRELWRYKLRSGEASKEYLRQKWGEKEAKLREELSYYEALTQKLYGDVDNLKVYIEQQGRKVLDHIPGSITEYRYTAYVHRDGTCEHDSDRLTYTEDETGYLPDLQPLQFLGTDERWVALSRGECRVVHAVGTDLDLIKKAVDAAVAKLRAELLLEQKA